MIIVAVKFIDIDVRFFTYILVIEHVLRLIQQLSVVSKSCFFDWYLNLSLSTKCQSVGTGILDVIGGSVRYWVLLELMLLLYGVVWRLDNNVRSFLVSPSFRRTKRPVSLCVIKFN